MEWDSTDITLIIGGLVTLTTAIVAGVIAIIRALNENQNKVEEVTEVQNEKLDNITVLVDGRYSDVLDRVATLQEMVATLTGDEHQKVLAKSARDASNEQNARVNEVENPTKSTKLDKPIKSDKPGKDA